MRPIVLVDANVLVSLALATHPSGTIRQVFEQAGLSRYQLMVAEESLDEFRTVMTERPYLRRRYPPERIDPFLSAIALIAQVLPPLTEAPPARSRDPRDDYLLEQAIRSRANVLLTGDHDLLALPDPPPGLRILEPRTFLDEIFGSA